MFNLFTGRLTRVKALAGGAAVAAIAVASLAGLQGSATAQAADAWTHRTHPKPTIVLVHGAWADSSSWGKVIPLLQQAGYTVLADPDPLRGLSSDAAYLSAFIKGSTTGPVILVGHSYGGAVITDAALDDPTVKALVYVDAFAPAKGQSCLGLLSTVPGGPSPAALFNEVSYPGAPAGDADLYLKTPVFVSAFANGVPAATAAVLAAEQRPVTYSALTEPGSTPAFTKLPSWWVLGTEDNIIPPSLQLTMAENAHSKITRVAAGHLSLLTAPAVVTRVIEAAARAAG